MQLHNLSHCYFPFFYLLMLLFFHSRSPSFQTGSSFYRELLESRGPYCTNTVQYLIKKSMRATTDELMNAVVSFEWPRCFGESARPSQKKRRNPSLSFPLAIVLTSSTRLFLLTLVYIRQSSNKNKLLWRKK